MSLRILRALILLALVACSSVGTANPVVISDVSKFESTVIDSKHVWIGKERQQFSAPS